MLQPGVYDFLDAAEFGPSCLAHLGEAAFMSLRSSPRRAFISSLKSFRRALLTRMPISTVIMVGTEDTIAVRT